MLTHQRSKLPSLSNLLDRCDHDLNSSLLNPPTRTHMSDVRVCGRLFSSACTCSNSTSLPCTWRKFPTSICQAVAPRVLFSLADAERLLDTQEEAEAIGQSQDKLEQGSVIRDKRLLFNARCASAVTKDWIELCEIEASFDREHDSMRPFEIARSHHAFYCVWTIGVIGMAPRLQHKASAFLDECSPRELCRLDEMASYAMYYNHNNFGSVGLDFQDEVWKMGCDLVSTRWVEVAQEGRHFRQVNGHKLNLFVFFDETLKYLETIDDE